METFIEIKGIIKGYLHAKKCARTIADPENNIGQAIGTIAIDGRIYQIQILLVVDKAQWKGEGRQSAIHASYHRANEYRLAFEAGYKARNDQATVPFEDKVLEINIRSHYNDWRNKP